MPTFEYERPWMYPKQAASMFCEERYGCVEATTKSGKTVSAYLWLAEKAIVSPRQHRHFWWVAPVKEQSRIPFRRLRQNLLDGGYPQKYLDVNETDRRITLLPNDNSFWFKGSDEPDNLYGEDVDAAVMDEASRCKEAAWHAVRSTLTATRGPIRLIGNVRGRRNWFYKLCRRAEAGEPNMHYAKITAYDAVYGGVMESDELDDARSVYGADSSIFKELYLAEASEDGANPFGLRALQAISGPLSDAEPAAWGWDFARSRDYCAGIALDQQGQVCRIERWNQSDLPQTAKADVQLGDSHPEYWDVTLARVRDLTGTRLPARVDATGPGGPIDQAFRASGHKNIEGYVFSRPSKQQLMVGLALAIQQRRTGSVPTDSQLAVEAEAFEYKYTPDGGVIYTAPEGMHDDLVCAWALAVEALYHAGKWAGWLAHIERESLTLTSDRVHTEDGAEVLA